MRIDQFLCKCQPDVSRSAIQKWIKDGNILVQEKTCKANYRINPGDTIALFVPEPVEVSIQPQDIPLDILYEDKDLLIVNKPKGMVVHPAPGHPDGTLVNAIMYHCKESLSGINGEIRPGIVHRIDQDTIRRISRLRNRSRYIRSTVFTGES